MIPCSRALFSLFFVLLAIIAVDNTVSAEPADMQHTILTEYQRPDGKQSSFFRQWLVTVIELPEGSRMISFSSSRATSKHPLSTVTISKTGDIDWRGTIQKRSKKSSNGVMILPGHPLPCDIIPPQGSTTGPTFADRVTAGGRVFVRQYHLSYHRVHRNEAVTEGWIKESTRPDYSSLEMRTIVDDEGTLVVRQLWPEGAQWWVYEETPFRRSWLVE